MKTARQEITDPELTHKRLLVESIHRVDEYFEIEVLEVSPSRTLAKVIVGGCMPKWMNPVQFRLKEILPGKPDWTPSPCS
jgi:hypothetical protein